MDFNKQNERLFIVGTEEGLVYKCSRGYQNRILETFDAHSMAVYACKWNPFYPKYFITCSADWRIKIWDYSLM
jgi:dynein intermediate chain 1